MAVFVSPGAYVREIDLSIYIPAIGQTIFGVVGGATKGPINEATFVSGQADFVRKFGNPTDVVGFGQYGMLQFLRRGTRGWYVRVGDGTQAPATVDVVGQATAAQLVSNPNVWAAVTSGIGAYVIGSIPGTFDFSNAPSDTLDFSVTDGAGVALPRSPFVVNLDQLPVSGSAVTPTSGTGSIAEAINWDVNAAECLGTNSSDSFDMGSGTTDGLDIGYTNDYTTNNFDSFEFVIGAQVAQTAAQIATAINGAITSAGASGLPGGLNHDDYIEAVAISGAVMIISKRGGANSAVKIRPFTGGNDAYTELGFTEGAEDDAFGVPGSPALGVKFGLERITADGVNAGCGPTANDPVGHLRITHNTADPDATITINSTGEGAATAELLGMGTTNPPATCVDGAAVVNQAIDVANVGSLGTNLVELTTNIGGVGSRTESILLTPGLTTAAEAALDFNQSGVLNNLMLEVFATTNGEVVLRGIPFAECIGTVPELYTLSSQAIAVELNSVATPIEVTLDDASTTATEVVGDINADATFAAGALAFVGPGGTVGIRSLQQGSASQVKIVAVTGAGLTDAYTELGFTVGQTCQTLAASSGDSITVTAATSWPEFGGVGQAQNFTPPATVGTVIGSNGGAATMTIDALTPGTWGNNLRIKIKPGTYLGTFAIEVFQRTTSTSPFNVVESWDGLVFSPAASPDYYVTRINAAIGGSEFITVTEVAGALDLPNGASTIGGQVHGPMIGGLDGFGNLTAGQYIGTNPAPTGLQIFRSAELIDVNLMAVPGISDPAVINAMVEICETRGDAMCIVDPPMGLDVQNVVDWHNGAGVYASSHAAFNTSYAALYWPWIQIFDSYNNQNLVTPPSGHVAAVYAYNDVQRELWFAPAGLQRGFVPSAVKLEIQSPSQGERDLMYGFPNNVNPIVSFTGQGIVVWGQKTLWRQPTAVDRVNVRRLLLYARKVIASTVRFLVFEPNDRVTQRAFINLVTPWLRNIQKKRGLLEFKVICDETTNPPELVDQSIMNGQIFLRPTKAAEIIITDFVLTSTGAKFEELIY